MRLRRCSFVLFAALLSACGGSGASSDDTHARDAASTDLAASPDAAATDADSATDGQASDGDGHGPPDATGPDGDAGAADAELPPPVGERPEFTGIAQTVAAAPGELTLRWLEATDDATPASELRYLVFASPGPDVDTTQPPVAEAQGVEELEVTGLPPGKLTWLVVLVEDADLNRSLPGEATPAFVTELPLAVTSPVLDLREVATTAISPTGFELASGDAGDAAAGTLVLLDNPSGRQLRRVVTRTDDSGTATLETERAALSDAFSGGTFATTARLPDLGEDTQAPSIPSGLVWRPESPRRRTTRDGAVEVTQTRARSVELLDAPPLSPRASTALTSEAKLDFALSFEPSVSSRVRWGDALPEVIEVVARGRVRFDATATYDLAGQAEHHVRKELFSRTVTLRYAVAGVPVYQEATLTFFAELDLEAQGAFHAQAAFTATKDIAVGFRWTEAGGFQTIHDEGFERTTTLSVDGHVTAKARLKVYPVLTTSFYKSALLLLWVKPTVDLDARARLLPAPAEFEKFDVTFFVDAEVGANASILGHILPEYRSGDFRMLTVPVFSLPALDLRVSQAHLDTCGTRRAYLRVADGYANAVAPSAITWEVAGGGASVVPDAGGAAATFSATSAGTYTLRASAFGDGFLGALGTRHASVDLEVAAAPPGDCDPANSEVSLREQAAGCVDNGLGWLSAPMPTRTMYGEDEAVAFEWDAFCEPTLDGSAGVCLAGALAGVRYQTPGGAHVSWPLASYDGPVEVPAGVLEYRAQSGGAVLDLEGAPPGDIAVVVGELRNNYGNSACPGDCRRTGYFEDEQTGVMMERRSRVLLTADPPVNEECEAPVLLPPFQAKVVRDGGEEADDDPAGAPRLPIGGQPTRSVHRGWYDRDFYRVRPEVEPAFGSPWDADLPYEPDCPVEVTLTDAFGTPRSPLAVFADAESARGGAGALAWDRGARPGYVVFEGVAGEDYYVAVHDEQSGAAEGEVYQVQARSVCDWGTDIPRLTAPPELASATIGPQSSTTVTLHFTPDTTRVIVRLITESGDGAGNGAAQQTSGETTLTLPVDTFYTSGKYLLEVRLERQVGDFPDYSLYDHDPLAPEGTYRWQVNQDFAATNHASGIPLQYVQVK
ncbi:MAG: hypothetical protein H6744_03030 [Deltaproteobacteria bacterium]|nr:hypothetical protein [Deltaproteobacteria bacterium]